MPNRKCPGCGRELINESQVYLIAVRQGEERETLVSGSDAGRFCAVCPVVVLVRKHIRNAVAIGLGNAGPAEFAVLGLVDLDAIPPEKRDLPLGANGNPIPLVKFTNDH